MPFEHRALSLQSCPKIEALRAIYLSFSHKMCYTGTGTLAVVVYCWGQAGPLNNKYASLCHIRTFLTKMDPWAATGRMGEVQRRLVETHKEKVTSDMDLAVANAARSELGTRLAMAQNEIAAVTARFTATAGAHPEGFNR